MYNQSESDLNIEMSKILTTKRLVEQNYKLTIIMSPGNWTKKM